MASCTIYQLNMCPSVNLSSIFSQECDVKCENFGIVNRLSNPQSIHGGTQAVLPSERFELGPDGPSRFPLEARAPSRPPLGLAAPSSSLVTSIPSLGLFAAACSWLLLEASTPRPDLRRFAVGGAQLIVGAGW